VAGASGSGEGAAGAARGPAARDALLPDTARAVPPQVGPAAGTGARALTGAHAGRAGRKAGPRGKSRPVPAATLPVARVAVDMPLAHLDRPFDYQVPESMADTAVAGCRVRVRFAGRLANGFLLERVAASEHAGSLAYLERVVSPEPVLTPEIAGLARAVADRYAGTLADVLRLAVPPRHAAAESASGAAGAAPVRGTSGHRSDGARAAPRGRPGIRPEPGTWSRYRAGPSFLTAIADGRSPRAVWSALPGPHWGDEIAVAAATAAAAGRGALIVVPDARDLSLLDLALTGLLGSGQHVCLAAGLGPAERYRRWLRILRGEVSIVAGNRSAMFAPVANLGLVAIWDEGDDLHAEPRAPYPHAREVLALRAHRTGAAALIGGFARTAEATQLVAVGWAHALEADRPVVRRCAPQISATGEDSELARDEAARSARLPSLALRTAREALGNGPVLFQVPRRGYVVAVACGHCHAPARCSACGGPLTLPGAQRAAVCGWCGALGGWECPRCGDTRLRAAVIGAGRTAEELGRAFPSVPVRTSGGDGVIAEVPGSPAVVVATPGAEPHAESGYQAAVLLDGWALLGRPSLRAAEEALRRWMNAAALVRPAVAGGAVVVVAAAGLPAVQALIRWDPVTHAERELAERAELRFPPAVRMASLTGPKDAVAGLLAAAELPAAAEVLGPVPLAVEGNLDHPDQAGEQVRALIRLPRAGGSTLAAALHAAQAVRSAHKDPGSVRLQLDPAELI
jgi:primosomal protein N' (replication factor Y) (superfamily II helicase)